MTQPYNPEDYWDEVAENITKRKGTKLIAGDDEPYYRYKRKRFLELLDSVNFSDKRVLEIGSGPGGNLEHIYPKGCKKITGVDISSHMIEISRELLLGKDVDIVKINGRELPFETNSFDIVFTSTVLQHNTDEKQLRSLVAEICRVSKDEVLLFERIESKIKGHESNLGRPVRYYAELLKENGFALEGSRFLAIQASYFICGSIRKLFNPNERKEGESLSSFSMGLERMALPVTAMFDMIVPSRRDVALLKFKRQ